MTSSPARLNKTRSRGRYADLPRLLGGTLCLDFVNTVEARAGDAPHDFLTDADQLARWGAHVGALTDDDLAAVRSAVDAHPRLAGAELARAVALRERLHVLLSGPSSGSSDRGAWTDVANQVRETQARCSFVERAGVVEWRPENGLHLVRDLVVLDAARLLVSEDLQRVRRCPGCGDCGWLFLDTSRNHSRRWCSMEGCGSRAKMRRQYGRLHPASG